MNTYNNEINIDILYDYVDAPQKLSIEAQNEMEKHLRQNEMDREVVESYRELTEKGITRAQLQSDYESHEKRFSAYVKRNQGRYRLAFYWEQTKKWVSETIKAATKALWEFVNCITIQPKKTIVDIATACVFVLFGVGVWNNLPSDNPPVQENAFSFFEDIMKKIYEQQKVDNPPKKREVVIDPNRQPSPKLLDKKPIENKGKIFAKVYTDNKPILIPSVPYIECMNPSINNTCQDLSMLGKVTAFHGTSGNDYEWQGWRNPSNIVAVVTPPTPRDTTDEDYQQGKVKDNVKGGSQTISPASIKEVPK